MYIAAIINPDNSDILFVDNEMFIYLSEIDKFTFYDSFKTKSDAISSIKNDINIIRNLENTDTHSNRYIRFYTSTNINYYTIDIIKHSNLELYIRKIKLKKLLKK